MAVTGVGLQTSLYITLLLIFPPVISLLLFVAVSLFHSRSLFLSDLSVFHLESFFSFLAADCCGPRRCCCAAGCHRWAQIKRKEKTQLFYFFSSFCHNIPPMLKGLDYFAVTSSALSFLFFSQNALWRRRSRKSVCFCQHSYAAQMLFENVWQYWHWQRENLNSTAQIRRWIE